MNSNRKKNINQSKEIRKLFVLIIYFFSFYSVLGQDEVILFNNALKNNIRKYNIASNIAFENGDLESGKILFDSLVSTHLIDTKFKDYTLKRFKKKKVILSSFKKPLFILTYASWCVPSKGEIPALNKLAQEYSNKIQFIIIFWDHKNKLKKISNSFDRNIEVCYANESYKSDMSIIANLKHTLGFPTSYYLNEELIVKGVKRGGAHPESNSTFLNALNSNYDLFKQNLSCLLVDSK